MPEFVHPIAREVPCSVCCGVYHCLSRGRVITRGESAFGTSRTAYRDSSLAIMFMLKRSLQCSRLRLGKCRHGAAPLLTGSASMMSFPSVCARRCCARADIPRVLAHTSDVCPRETCGRRSFVALFGRTNCHAS